MTPDLRLRVQCPHGIFTIDDALSCGFTPEGIRRRERRGIWRRLTRGVFAAMTTPLAVTGWERSLMESYPNQMALSHLSAARAWDLPVPDDDPRAWMTVDQNTRWKLPAEVRPVRTRHMPTTWSRDGLSLTPPDRTVVDLAMCLDRVQLRQAVGDALQRRLTLLSRLLTETNRLSRRAGHTMLRGVLREFAPGFENELERELGGGMLRAGIDAFEPQYVVRGPDGRIWARYDFAAPELRLGLEADGWAFHGSIRQQARDKRRDRRMARIDWTTLRFGPEEIFHDLAATLVEIAQFLAHRRAA